MTNSPSESADGASGPEAAPLIPEDLPLDLPAYLAERRVVIDRALQDALPRPERWPIALHEAMAYSLFGGGKRLRPIVALAAFESISDHWDAGYEAVLPAACAVEMIHTYSLIHDDLPCMDDDDERRGRLTCHKKFGEALALLAGDALLTEAFRVVADEGLYRGTSDPVLIVRITRELSEAAGMRGMAGGQALDLGFEGSVDQPERLAFLHRRKTGALFRFSCLAGGLLARGSDSEVQALARFGETLGLAFQVADDLLDLEEDGPADAASGDGDAIPSFPALLGEEASHERARELADEAIACLEDLPEATALRCLARYAVERDY